MFNLTTLLLSLAMYFLGKKIGVMLKLPRNYMGITVTTFGIVFISVLMFGLNSGSEEMILLTFRTCAVIASLGSGILKGYN